jgi:hypothetical protein
MLNARRPLYSIEEIENSKYLIDAKEAKKHIVDLVGLELCFDPPRIRNRPLNNSNVRRGIE